VGIELIPGNLKQERSEAALASKPVSRFHAGQECLLHQIRESRASDLVPEESEHGVEMPFDQDTACRLLPARPSQHKLSVRPLHAAPTSQIKDVPRRHAPDKVRAGIRCTHRWAP
jgi:hypothetical protein